MKFFVDTAEVSEIIELNDLGMVDGVTTNPSLIKKSCFNSYAAAKPSCKAIRTSPFSASPARGACTASVSPVLALRFNPFPPTEICDGALPVHRDSRRP